MTQEGTFINTSQLIKYPKYKITYWYEFEIDSFCSKVLYCNYISFAKTVESKTKRVNFISNFLLSENSAYLPFQKQICSDGGGHLLDDLRALTPDRYLETPVHWDHHPIPNLAGKNKILNMKTISWSTYKNKHIIKYHKYGLKIIASAKLFLYTSLEEQERKCVI